MTNNIEVTFPIDSIVVWDNGETNVLGTVLSTGAGCYSVLLRDRTIRFVSTTALREPTPNEVSAYYTIRLPDNVYVRAFRMSNNRIAFEVAAPGVNGHHVIPDVLARPLCRALRLPISLGLPEKVRRDETKEVSVLQVL